MWRSAKPHTDPIQHVLCCFSCVWLFVILWTVACQAPLSMRFPRQQYWSGLPCPLPGDLLDLGIELASPALAGGFFTTEPQGKHYPTPGLDIKNLFPRRRKSWRRCREVKRSYCSHMVCVCVCVCVMGEHEVWWQAGKSGEQREPGPFLNRALETAEWECSRVQESSLHPQRKEPHTMSRLSTLSHTPQFPGKRGSSGMNQRQEWQASHRPSDGLVKSPTAQGSTKSCTKPGDHDSRRVAERQRRPRSENQSTSFKRYNWTSTLVLSPKTRPGVPSHPTYHCQGSCKRVKS